MIPIYNLRTGGFKAHSNQCVCWSHLLDDLCPRVKVAVHTVTKPKQLLLLSLDARNEGRDVLKLADALQHAQHGLVGTTMQGAVQSTHST